MLADLTFKPTAFLIKELRVKHAAHLSVGWLHPHVLSASLMTIQRTLIHHYYTTVPTLARHDETGNAVGNAGAGGQEGDAHDDVGDAQGEADDGDLHIMGWSSQCCQKELQFKLSISLTFHRLPREERLCRNFQFKFVVDSSLTNQNINLIGCKKKYTVFDCPSAGSDTHTGSDAV